MPSLTMQFMFFIICVAFREYRISTGDIPVPASGACVVSKDQYMYVFAGYTVNGGSSEIYQLNLRTWVWKCLTEKIKDNKLKPSPRDKFVGWEYENK